MIHSSEGIHLALDLSVLHRQSGSETISTKSGRLSMARAN